MQCATRGEPMCGISSLTRFEVALLAAERRQHPAWGVSPRKTERTMPISRGAATENGTVTMLSPLRGFRSFSITNPGARAPGYMLPCLRH